MAWDMEVERRFLAHACRDSFWNFFRYAFGVSQNPALQRWLTPRIHQPLCDWLEWHGKDWLARRSRREKGITHLLVIVPRNFGKTTIVTRAFPIWLHLQDVDISTFIGSENLTRAISFFEPVRSILDGSDPYARFSWLYGNWYDKDRAWNSERVVHAARRAVARQDPSIGVWGVESGLTGAHPDVLILDDPTSYEKLAAINNWLQYVNSHCDSLVPVINPDGMFINVGTRYHDGDHLGRAIREEGVKTLFGMDPPGGIECKGNGKWHLYFMAARDGTGKPVFPEVWAEQRLRDYEKVNNLHYWAQVMNDPSSSEFTPLTREQVTDLWVDQKQVPPNLRYTIHIDTAFKSRKRQVKGDESVIQVWGHSRDGSGEVYFIEGYSSRTWRMEEFLKQMVLLLQRYRQGKRRISMITDEREVGGHEGAWELAMRAACIAADVPMPKLILLTRGITKKENRLIEAASYWAEGYVRLPREAPGVARLVDQMIRIGSSDHDDWADCASDVFHKDVYIPLRDATGDRQPPSPVYPGDDVLKSGRLTDSAALALYDQKQELTPYEPVN